MAELPQSPIPSQGNYDVTVQQALDSFVLRYENDESMLDENKKKNIANIKNFVKNKLVKKLGVSLDKDLSFVNNMDTLTALVELSKKFYKTERARGEIGVWLKALINVGKPLNIAEPNQVSQLEEKTKGDRSKGFNISATRDTKQKSFPPPWSFHKTLNDAFATLPDQNIKAFAMTKLFSGIRNPDILRLEVMPSDAKLRKDNATYVDLASRKVYIYNKGNAIPLDLGTVLANILVDTAEEAKAAGRDKLFPEKESVYRENINTAVRQMMKERGLSIQVASTFEEIPFSIKDLRANIFDTLEDQFGKDTANKVLGHSTADDVGMAHYKVQRTARRSTLNKASTVDHFAKMFLEDILYSEDSLGQISIPEDKGLSPKAFFLRHGFTGAADRAKDIIPVTGNGIDRAVESITQVISMDQKQVESQINSFHQVVKDLSTQVGSALKSVQTEVDKLTKSMGDLFALKEKSSTVKTLDDMSSEERASYLEDNRKPSDTDAITEYRIRKKEDLPIPEGLRTQAISDLDDRSNKIIDDVKKKVFKPLIRGGLKVLPYAAFGAAGLAAKGAEAAIDVAVDPSQMGTSIENDPEDMSEDDLVQNMQSNIRTSDLTPVSNLAGKELSKRVTEKQSMLGRKSSPLREGPNSINTKARNYVEKYRGPASDFQRDLEEEYQGFAMKQLPQQ